MYVWNQVYIHIFFVPDHYLDAGNTYIIKRYFEVSISFSLSYTLFSFLLFVSLISISIYHKSN